MALALDGSGHATNGAWSGNTVTLTTTAAGVICVAVEANGGPVTSITARGLTFTKRSGPTSSGTDQTLEIWSAASSTAQTSLVITVNTSFASRFATVDAFGVSGCDITTIWDSNASLPDVRGTGGPTADPAIVSTTTADTFIIGAFRMGSQATPTAGTGFTAISGADYLLTEYKIVAAAQTSLNVTIGTGVGDANGAIGDAIIIAAAAGLAPRRLTVRQAVNRAATY